MIVYTGTFSLSRTVGGLDHSITMQILSEGMINDIYPGAPGLNKKHTHSI